MNIYEKGGTPDSANRLLLLLAQMPEALPRDAQAAGFRIYHAQRVVALHYDRSAPGAQQLLATAVQVTRLLAKLDATSSGSLDEREQIRDCMGRIETALGHLRPLRSAVTGIEKETGTVRKHAGELEAEIRRALVDIATALTAALLWPRAPAVAVAPVAGGVVVAAEATW